MLRLIAITSLHGGVGATTVTANLAAALHAEGQDVLAIDLCPNNLLRLHFAMPWHDRNGLAPQLAEDRPWYEAAWRSEAGIPFIPFGYPPDPTRGADIVAFLGAKGGLREQLELLDLPSGCWVIVDCPGIGSEVTRKMFDLADHALIVVNADPTSYAMLQDARLDGSLLLNRFDPRLQLDRDIGDLLRHRYGPQMLPLTIHRDESLREALAWRQTVFDYAPDSQARQDLLTLATWIRAHVAEEVAA